MSQEEANLAEVLRDEERRKTLIELFFYRNQVPREELNVLDLDELESMWAALNASNAAPEKTSATKLPAKSKAKAPAKTPAKKVNAPRPEPDTVRIDFLSQFLLANTL